MKQILKISAIAFCVLLNSCVKDANPTDIATEDQVTLETLARGIPAALVKPNSTGYGLPWDFGLPAIHLATESMTGDLVISGNIGYDWFQQWGTNNAIGADYAVGALTWNNYYSWIMMANNVINLIDESNLALLDDKERSYLGFAYTYRAMFYLDLVRLYEFKANATTKGDHLLGLGVPIVLPQTTEDQAKNNPRAKVEDVYNKLIFPDLEKAELFLSSFSAPDKYTISLALIYGLKARAYLERGTDKNDIAAYKSAAEYARKAITASGCTPMTQAQWEDPVNGFNNASSNNAWIWGLALPSESVSNLTCFTAHMSCENDWSPYHAGRAINRNLYNSINLYDFRRHSWLDPTRSSYDYPSCRPDGKTYFANTLKEYSCIKFRPAQGAYKEFKVGGAADHCCMRVEEMYFIEAEATAQAGDVAAGIELLNKFMTSYRMTGGRAYSCPSKQLAGFVNELMLQKRIEFWGEGIVMFDMKRLNLSSKRGYVGTNAPTSYRLNNEGRAPYWNFVIGRNEVQNNPVIGSQNNPDPSGLVTPWKG